LWENGQEFAQGWNFGPKDEDTKSVRWIVEYLTKAWTSQGTWQIDQQVQPHEAHYLKLDCSKAKNLLNWSPLINIEQSLEWIILWYSKFYQQKDAREITLEQIKNYCNLAFNHD
jgi:CDP-glucose 4,6-dehydratase